MNSSEGGLTLTSTMFFVFSKEKDCSDSQLPSKKKQKKVWIMISKQETLLHNIFAKNRQPNLIVN